MAGMLKEFREFALKGSVIDLAVGIIIGTAFGAVVKGLVDEIIMPAVGVMLGGVDFSDRYYVLKGENKLIGNETLPQAREAGATVIGYGQFLNLILIFFIVAFCVFLLVKGVNRLRRKQQKGATLDSSNRPCPECLTQIPKEARRCASCTASVVPLPPPPPAPGDKPAAAGPRT